MHPNYPSCDRLRIVSKESLFYEPPFPWGDRQNTPCSGFAKGLRFLNMVMTFILHPLSHYNTIIDHHAWFLLSLLEEISVDFLSHFILSLIDVYKDTVTRDKLIFPSTITMIICHFSIPCPMSDQFSVMDAIDTAIVKRSKAQLCLRRTQIETAAPLASLAPSTSAPSSSTSRVTLYAIMA